MSKAKAIIGKYAGMVQIIERTEYTDRVEHYSHERGFEHVTRSEWRNSNWRDAFVFIRGAFYMLTDDRAATVIEYHEISADDLRTRIAETIRRRCYAATISAYTFEEVSALRALAVLEYGADQMETWKSVAQTMLSEIIDSAEPELEPARQNAAELEQRAELLASIEDPATREWITAEAIAHDWSAEETAETITFFRNIRTANRAALALLDAYAAVTGEYPEEYDPESIAAYRVARDEIADSHIRATAEELEIVADMVETIADDVRDLAAARLEFATRPADLTAYQSDYCTFEPTREPYQRAELETYLGDFTDDYDVDAIESEATETDPKTGRVFWRRDIDLWTICERHELTEYRPAAI